MKTKGFGNLPSVPKGWKCGHCGRITEAGRRVGCVFLCGRCLRLHQMDFYSKDDSK